MNDSPEVRVLEVPAEMAGERVDRALARLLPEHSRSRLQTWLRDGKVRVDEQIWRPRDRVAGGERLEVIMELECELDSSVKPQAIPLNILHEDEAVLVVNKPPGLVVHPGAGNPDQTLQNALLHHLPELAAVPRAGIVHRLDKDTSGLMVVARTLEAHTALVTQMRARRIEREYAALVVGEMVAGGCVDQPLGRHPRDRVRMSVQPGGRRAVTHYRVWRRFRAYTLLRVRLETGRTHQIRVHMAWLRHPVVGDPVYGGRLLLPKAADESLRTALRAFRRQALHACRLAFTHPLSDQPLSFEAPIPDDMRSLIQLLPREDHP